MIFPPSRRAIIVRATRCEQRNAPVALMARVLLQAASSIHSTTIGATTPPALFTRMSMCPKASMVWATILSTAWLSVTSTFSGSPRTPRALISSAVLFRPSHMPRP